METKTQSAGHGVSFLHNQARHETSRGGVLPYKSDGGARRSFSEFGARGALLEFLVGLCRLVLQILTRFQTKKGNFTDPFSDQTSELHTRFQTWP